MMTVLQLLSNSASQNFVSITEPQVPRNKRAPGRFEVGTGTPLFPVTPVQVYRRIYFEALDLIVSSIEERFDQPSFKAYSNMESLLIGVLSSQDVASQMDYMKENYAEDVRTGYLFSPTGNFESVDQGCAD